MFDLHGLVRVAVFKTLQIIGLVIGIVCAGLMLYELVKLDDAPRAMAPAAQTRCMFDARDLVPQMQDGTCTFVLKMYGTNAIYTLSSGDCLMAMSAFNRPLDIEEVNQGEQL